MVEKLNKQKLEELLSESSIRNAFMQRKDIKELNGKKQEELWEQHKKNISKFMNFLSDCETLVL